MRRAAVGARVLAMALLGGAAASAQDAPAPPWSRAAAPPPTSVEVSAEVPRAARWPSGPTAAPARHEAVASWRPAPRRIEDPGMTQHFQMPSAVLLRYGDFAGMYLSHLGWVGLRRGLTRYIDVGVGVPYYFLGLSVDARVGFLQREGLAAAWWGYASIPFVGEGERPTSQLGFTWSYAGLGWATGPLLSLWNDRVGVHAGVHVAQRTGLGGAWLMSHVTAEVRIIDGIKALVQGVSFNELSPEKSETARPLVGNGSLRWLPYALVGARFYTRRFSADMGVLAPLSEDCPLWSERLVVIPWVALTHRF